MTQTQESGAEAARFGHTGAAQVAEKIGAIRISSRSNEFDLKGQRVTIRMARLGNKQVGVLYAMLERVQAVIGAFETSPNEFEILSISPDTFQQFMRDSKTGEGQVGLVRKSVFEERGKRLGKISLRA